MRATLSNHRQSTRKTKLLADLVRGKSVSDARTMLHFTDRKAADVFKKLIESAVANARALGIAEEVLFVKEIKVDQGVAIKRFMPQSRGRAHAFRRKASHISVVLGSKTGVPAKGGSAVPAAKKAAKRAKKAAKKAVKKS